MTSSKKIGVSVVGVLTAIYCFSFIHRQLPAVLGSLIRSDLSLSFSDLGLLYGTWFSVFYAVSGLFMGRLADILSRKWMIILSLLTWSVATLLSGFASGFIMLVVMRVFIALGQSASSPASYSLLAEWFPDRLATMISIYASGIFIGISASFLLGGSIGNLSGWRSAFIMLGSAGVVLALLSMWMIPASTRTTKGETPIHPHHSFWYDVRMLLAIKAFRWHLIGFGLLAFSGYSVLSFISSVLRETHRAPDLVPHYGWFMLGTGITVNLAGWISDYMATSDERRRYYPALFASVAGLPLYLIGFFSGNGLTTLLCVGLGACLASSYNGVAAALVQVLSPRHTRGLAVGMYLFVISLVGLGAGPLISGLLMDMVFTGPERIVQALAVVTTGSGVLGFVALWRSMRNYGHIE